MSDATNPGAVVPASQTVPNVPAVPIATATMNVAGDAGLFSGWSTLGKVTGLTGMSLIVAGAFLFMLNFTMKSAGESHSTLIDLLRESVDRQANSTEKLADEMKEVKKVGYQNQRIMRESAEAGTKSADATTKAAEVMTKSAESIDKSLNSAVAELKRIGKSEPAKAAPPPDKD